MSHLWGMDVGHASLDLYRTGDQVYFTVESSKPGVPIVVPLHPLQVEWLIEILAKQLETDEAA